MRTKTSALAATKISPGKTGKSSPNGDIMTKAEARRAVTAINAAMVSVRAQILELHRRQGWMALGYSSWRECVAVEFEKSQSSVYRELSAGIVETEISPNGEIGVLPEGPIRPLSRLPKGSRKDAWEEAVQAMPSGKPTAKVVRKIVERKLAELPPAERPRGRHLDDHVNALRNAVGKAFEEWPTDRRDVFFIILENLRHEAQDEGWIDWGEITRREIPRWVREYLGVIGPPKKNE